MFKKQLIHKNVYTFKAYLDLFKITDTFLTAS